MTSKMMKMQYRFSRYHNNSSLHFLTVYTIIVVYCKSKFIIIQIFIHFLLSIFLFRHSAPNLSCSAPLYIYQLFDLPITCSDLVDTKTSVQGQNNVEISQTWYCTVKYTIKIIAVFYTEQKKLDVFSVVKQK